ncbi:hypothetical protein DSO57_1004513 [Entomophthora muscae]|uniref:Uncharacterized protein n=1 Tax=Entomophthora muscae TaxID=34485 RepID=A0ACC2RN89_9FUNG|nr:hypothetical protein DSO57_1004513 [Entomophthora muscae]
MVFERQILFRIILSIDVRFFKLMGYSFIPSNICFVFNSPKALSASDASQLGSYTDKISSLVYTKSKSESDILLRLLHHETRFCTGKLSELKEKLRWIGNKQDRIIISGVNQLRLLHRADPSYPIIPVKWVLIVRFYQLKVFLLNIFEKALLEQNTQMDPKDVYGQHLLVTGLVGAIKGIGILSFVSSAPFFIVRTDTLMAMSRLIMKHYHYKDLPDLHLHIGEPFFCFVPQLSGDRQHLLLRTLCLAKMTLKRWELGIHLSKNFSTSFRMNLFDAFLRRYRIQLPDYLDQ